MNAPWLNRRILDPITAVALILSLLLSLSPAPSAQAQGTRSPTISVDDVALGGVLRITGYGFAPTQIYSAHPRAGRQTTPLGRLTVQCNGELSVTANPSLASGHALRCDRAPIDGLETGLGMHPATAEGRMAAILAMQFIVTGKCIEDETGGTPCGS